jgi:hypothetical protein
MRDVGPSLPGPPETGTPGLPLGAPPAAVRKPLELPPELLAPTPGGGNPGRSSRGPRPGSAMEGRSRGGVPEVSGSRGLLILAGVVVLGLTALLASFVLHRGNSKARAEAMAEVTAARDEASLLLRRDDATSREEALMRLRTLTFAHPENVELLAELGLALAMQLDDTRVRAAALQEKAERLNARIRVMTETMAPADWRSRVNVMRDELTGVQDQMAPFNERGKELTREVVQVLKTLSRTPAEESAEVSQARMRARGMMEAVMGTGEALNMATLLAQSGQRKWSMLVVAEFVLNAPTSRTQVNDAIAGLERVREEDGTFLRPYVLGARISLMRKDPAAARALLDTVITLNPKHELAGQLHKQAEEMLQGP